MRVGCLIFLFTCIYTVLCHGEPDTSYIVSYPQRWGIRGGVSKNFIQIFDSEKMYNPNNPVNIGLGLVSKNSILFMGFYGLRGTEDERLGKTESFDIQFHTYRRRMIVDLFFQRHKGFYSWGEEDDEDEGSVELYPTLSAHNYGINFTYLFNGNRFSAKASFEQSERQLRSAGSWMVGGGGYLSWLNGGNALLMNGQGIDDQLQLGVNAGYGYAFVINSRWLLSGAITSGVYVGNEWRELKNGKLRFYPSNFFRGALSYNVSAWSIAITYLHNAIYTSYNDLRTVNIGSGNWQVIYVRRFDLPQLKK